MVVVKSVLRMNPGNEDCSYSRNSTLQEKVMSKARPILEERVKAILRSKSICSNNEFVMAELGCSSGPTALAATSVVVEAITAELCHQTGNSPLDDHILVFLNDLPGNDFNSVFMLLSSFYENLKIGREQEAGRPPKCFISAMPGSFYGRLFPRRSLHFVHSSYSLHWLSQVPAGLEDMKGDVFIAMASPPNVFNAYLKQFQRDFTTFLSCRADEIVAGGEMLLTLLGRSSSSSSTVENCLMWELLSKSLLEMAQQGLVEEADIDSFNLPHFKPSEEEVTDLVRQEGSFVVNGVELFAMNWDPLDDDEDNGSYKFDNVRSGRNVARGIRAVVEPMLTAHFGEGVSMDDLFGRYAVRVGEHLAVEKTKYANLVISLTRIEL